MAAIRDGLLRAAPVTVLGLARSGIALARFLTDAGARVTVYDGRPAADLAEAIAALDGRDVTLVLGPAVEPARSWADAALVTTSPSINPDYPTTEPRLREALTALVAARAHGDPSAPALVSEPDLFLRLCEAPTIGVTGTKGKTTTASLTAAILGADPAHPVVLGGNIGIPIVERLGELTPRPSRRLRAVRAAAADAVAAARPSPSTRTSPPTTWTGTARSSAYRAVKRRLAELVAPDGALVLNAEDPVVAGYAGTRAWRTAVLIPARPAAPGRRRRRRRLDRGERRGAPPPGRRRHRGDRTPMAGSCRSTDLGVPGAHNVSNALAAVAVGLLFGVEPDAIREAAVGVQGVEHRLGAGRRDRWRALRERLAGHPAGRGHRRAAGLRRAARADRRWARQGRRPGRARRGRRGASRRGRRHRRDRPRPRAPLPRRRSRARRTRDLHGRRGGARGRARALALRDASLPAQGDPAAGPATVLLSPAAASFDMFPDYAARGRAFKDRRRGPGCRGHRTSREGPMNLAPPIPRFGRGPATRRPTPDARRDARDVRRSANRTPAKKPTQVLQRERHEPDYLILMLVVALTAVGILMVYSSSAMRGYVSADADTFATVGPQIQWAVLGLIAMAAMMRVDYRYLRLASVPFLLVSLALLVLVFVPDYNIVVGGSARWLRLPGSAGHPPGRDREARDRHLPRPLVRQAGHEGPRLLERHRAVPDHHRAGHRAGVQGAGPRHDDRHRPDRASRCSSSPAPTSSISRRWAPRRSWR